MPVSVDRNFKLSKNRKFLLVVQYCITFILNRAELQIFTIFAGNTDKQL